jgi:hypothetical protein
MINTHTLPSSKNMPTPFPRPMVFKVDKVRTKFELKPSIPYENGGPIALCVNGAVVFTNDGIEPLPEVEGVETTVVRTSKGGLGGKIPSMVLAKMRV